MGKKTDRGSADAGSKFKIGAVSRITQIPVDTLRAWERRYQVVTPQRADSTARLYDGEDIERLNLIKKLIADGHAISSIANLSQAALEKMTRLHHTDLVDTEASTAAIANAVILSETRETLPLNYQAAEDIEILAHCRSWPDFETHSMQASPDALVIDIAALLRNRAQQIVELQNKCGAKRTIVIYGFAPAQVLAELVRAGVVTLRSPLDRQQLGRELLRPITQLPISEHPQPDAVVPRLLDNAVLEALANMSPTMQCECPHHLVEIVRILTQFEAYSVECANRDDEDAALHAKLHMTTSVARGIFEQALIEVAEYEGIPLPEHASLASKADA